MISTCIKGMLALACSSCLAMPAGAETLATLPPVQAFFQNVQMSAAEISPNGRYVIARASYKGVRRSLVLFDLATMTPKILAHYANGDVGSIFWLNDKRIGFTVINLDPFVAQSTSGLYAIGLDGKDAIGLAPAIVNQRSFMAEANLHGPGFAPAAVQGNWPRNGDDMPVMVTYRAETALGLMNTRTGLQTRVHAPHGSISWVLDESGVLRLTVGGDRELHTMRWLDPERNWRNVGSFAPASAGSLQPRALIDKTLYVQTRNGGDRSSLFRYNLERGALEEPALVTSPDFDIEGSAINEGKHLLGFRVYTDAESTVWFDPEMKALQAEIDVLLPTTVNRIARGSSSETPFVLVYAYSPVHPGDTLIFNRETKKMTRLGTALPGIVADQMAMPAETARYTARDGLSIPVAVTLPHVAVKKNLPTIILAASYPWHRNGAWAFDPAVQFLVSRGYAVVQPETRGARGFGAAHFQAGVRQWGLSMQDDLADSAKWAIAQGIADPKRICIAGAMYGGYAAMMGLVKDPQLFRCGISMAGIVDIKLMFKQRWDQDPVSGEGDDMQMLVGDPVRDGTQFNATSPLLNASRLTHPLLLAYGDKDAEVPGKQGRQLFEAIRAGNPDAELIMFDEKGAPAPLEKNRAELWTRIAQFLEHHIGKPQP